MSVDVEMKLFDAMVEIRVFGFRCEILYLQSSAMGLRGLRIFVTLYVTVMCAL